MAISQAQSVSASQSLNRGSSSQTSRSRSGQRYTPQQQQNLDWLFPDLQQRLAGVNPQQDFAQRLGAVGGTPTPFSTPPIVQAFSPEQIGKQINTYYSDAQRLTDAQTLGASGIAQNQSGRGFGVSQDERNRQERDDAIRQRNRITAAGQATQFDLGAAERNAGLELQSWLARLQSEALTSQDDTRRRQLALAQQGYDVQQQNALLNALNVNLRPLSFAEADASGQSSNFGRSSSISSYRAS